MSFVYDVAARALRPLEPERAHRVTINLLQAGSAPAIPVQTIPPCTSPWPAFACPT
jgi:hypothetical protein